MLFNRPTRYRVVVLTPSNRQSKTAIAANGTIPIAQDPAIRFSEKLQQLGVNVEKIYGVHGRAATREELRTSIDRRSASDLK